MSKRIPIVVGIMFLLIALWLLITPNSTIQQFIERLNNLNYDFMYKVNVVTDKQAVVNHITIIDIDDRSLRAIGRWPWPRKTLANLVTQLQNKGARVVAFDIFFSEVDPNIAKIMLQRLAQENKLTPAVASTLKNNVMLFDDDIVFAKSLTGIEPVLPLGFLPYNQTTNVLPKPLMALTPKQQEDLDIKEAKGYISNIAEIQNKAKGSGFINIFPDEDGIIRRTPLLIEYHGNLYPSLSLQAVMTFLGESIQLITHPYHHTQHLEGIKLGFNTIPTNEKSQVLIPFIGKSFTFPYYSAIDVLNGKVPTEAINGKLIFIGTSATGLGDLHPTTVQNPFPGVEIQATVARGILHNTFSYVPAWALGASIAITLLIGLAAAFIFPYLGPGWLALMIVIFPPLFTLLNHWLWQFTGLIISLLIPMLLVFAIALFNIMYGYLFESRRRERIKAMFGQYVPEKHIDEMLHQPEDLALQGESREMTVLFADIRNFTSMSENLSATELVEVLNTYLTPMTEIIFKNHGTVDKYVGDMIMAFWGAPLKDDKHAEKAIDAALEMHLMVRNLHQTLAKHHWPDIKIGIGINSGQMSVGDMGSQYRRNYTVIGDEVNLASRIEGLTKFYGVDIIVSENTKRDQHKFVFRQLDRVKVKGKNLSIAIYEVICKRLELNAALDDELEKHHQALEHYFKQQWVDAESLFLELHNNHPKVRIYKIFLDRIAEFKNMTLSADWDGVYVHATK